MLRKTLVIAALAIASLVVCRPVDAQIRLIGISGNQTDDPNFTPHQEAFWDINIADASSVEVGRVLFSPDTQAIAFNPADGLLYHTGGAESYRNDPTRIGYRDNHYMETFNPADLTPGSAVPPSVAIFNANGPNLPDDGPILEFGLPAPRPAWLLPVEPRTSAQNTDEFKNAQGEDEYHSLRGLAWSENHGLFFGSDEDGIFTLTTDGISNFIGKPRPDFGDVKGIAIMNDGGQERLFVGTKEQTGSVPFSGSELIEVDMTTGLEISSVLLLDPVVPTIGATGILGMAFHPETGVLYAVSKGENAGDPYARELITVDPVTGSTTLIASMGVNIASITFVFPTDDPVVPGDTDDDGDVDLDDLNAVRNNFGGAGNPIAGDTSPFDGDVDLDDLNAVRNNFGAGPGANPVPEPATALLALCGLAAIGWVARRK